MTWAWRAHRWTPGGRGEGGGEDLPDEEGGFCEAQKQGHRDGIFSSMELRPELMLNSLIGPEKSPPEGNAREEA